MSQNPPKDVVEVASHDLFGCLRVEIEYATTQKKTCLADSVDRETRDDASGAAYYKGLAVAYAQMAQRLKYLLPNAEAQTSPESGTKNHE